MPKLRLRENVAVFLVFFGIAFIEATQKGQWLVVLFWLSVGAVFLLGDNLQARKL